MTEADSTPSARAELLESAYRYALEHGLADLSLRPLATAIGSSPRALLNLFGSAVLATGQPDAERGTPAARVQQTAVLVVLRGALLDLLATGDLDRTTAAVHRQLGRQSPVPPSSIP